MNAYYLFRKDPIPENLGDEMAAALSPLKQCRSKETYLKEAYDLITTRYQSGRLATVFKLPQLFSRDLDQLWARKGFLHCTNQNYLLAVALVTGGLFNEKDIIRKWTLIGYCSPHQYLKIKLQNNQWIRVDCWGRHYGIPYGDYAHGFNGTLFKSFTK